MRFAVISIQPSLWPCSRRASCWLLRRGSHVRQIRQSSHGCLDVWMYIPNRCSRVSWPMHTYADKVFQWGFLLLKIFPLMLLLGLTDRVIENMSRNRHALRKKESINLWQNIYIYIYTLQETNISPKNGILKMIFLFPRWDMLIPWRVYILYTCIYVHLSLPPSFSPFRNLVLQGGTSCYRRVWLQGFWAHFRRCNREEPKLLALLCR